MIATSQSDEIRDFLKFLEQALAPDGLPERAGASPRDIARFVELAGLPLPALYLGYLGEFGEKDTVLKMADDSDTRVTTLIELYQQQQGQPDTEIPEHGVVIAAHGLTGQRALLYSEAAERGEEEPIVVVSWWGDVEYACARSFRNHLYRQAFVRGRLRRGAGFRLFKNDEGLLPEATRLAVGLGFVPYWFSDDCQACLERPDGAILYLDRSPQITVFEGRFPDERSRDQLKTHLMQTLTLKDATAG